MCRRTCRSESSRLRARSTAAPRPRKGELGYYIISANGTNPYRVKVRPPCFVNLSILPDATRGYLIADFIAIMGSIDFVMGEVDR